jgi:hypothetical protein
MKLEILSCHCVGSGITGEVLNNIHDCQKKQRIYTAFNPTIAKSTKNNHLSLYDVSPTCFGLYMAILREVSNKEI